MNTGITLIQFMEFFLGIMRTFIWQHIKTRDYRDLKIIISNLYKTIFRLPGVTLQYLLNPIPEGIGHIYSN